MGYLLNLDIFHNIMSFSDRTSTSRLMRTCRTLNHEGAKYLFMHTPQLWSEADAISFTQYAFARADVDEMVHRMHWLRSLQLNNTLVGLHESQRKFARTMAFCLSHFLVHAPNFVELELRTSEDLLSADTGFAKVVSEIVCLQKLTLMEAGPQALKMLRHSSLRLSSAHVCCIEDAMEPLFDDHPILALHNSQDTLRTLTVGILALDNIHSMPRYHNLVHLEFSSFLIPKIHRLAEIFPNLHTLHVKPYRGYSDLAVPVREEQRQARILGQTQHGTFRALRSYAGSILSLYLFAIACRIPSLQLRDDDYDDDGPCWDMRMLQAICELTRPAQLELYISSLYDWPSQAEGFVRLLASGDFKTMHTLTLHFDIMWGVRDIDPGPILECVYLAMRGSSVLAVVLVLDWQQFWDDYFEDEFDPESPPPAMAFMQSVDVEAVADELLRATKTLRTVVVRLLTHGQPEVRAQRGPGIDDGDIS